MKQSVILILTLLVLLALPLYAYAEDTTSPDTTITSGPSGKIEYSSPTIASDGTIYIGSGDNKLYANLLRPGRLSRYSQSSG